MIKSKGLAIGERFTCMGIEWICLDIIDGNYLAITAEVWKELPFDVDDGNNWKWSSLRGVLNSEFIELVPMEYLVMQTSDLTADNGERVYGTSEDYVTILSCEQYRKYRELIPDFGQWTWTLTPWSCEYPQEVRSITPNGIIAQYHAFYNIGVVPVCLFSSKLIEDYERRVAELTGGIGEN